MDFKTKNSDPEERSAKSAGKRSRKGANTRLLGGGTFDPDEDMEDCPRLATQVEEERWYFTVSVMTPRLDDWGFPLNKDEEDWDCLVYGGKTDPEILKVRAVLAEKMKQPRERAAEQRRAAEQITTRQQPTEEEKAPIGVTEREGEAPPSEKVEISVSGKEKENSLFDGGYSEEEELPYEEEEEEEVPDREPREEAALKPQKTIYLWSDEDTISGSEAEFDCGYGYGIPCPCFPPHPVFDMDRVWEALNQLCEEERCPSGMTPLDKVKAGFRTIIFEHQEKIKSYRKLVEQYDKETVRMQKELWRLEAEEKKRIDAESKGRIPGIPGRDASVQVNRKAPGAPLNKRRGTQTDSAPRTVMVEGATQTDILPGPPSKSDVGTQVEPPTCLADPVSWRLDRPKSGDDQ